MLSIYGAVTFYQTHDFRTPILFQNPIPLKKTAIISPVGKEIVVTPVKTEKRQKTIKELIVEATIREFGKENVEAMNILIFKESSFNPMAMNKTSGACGLFQFYPCQKLLNKCPDMDIECQIEQGVSYIKARYTNPIGALAFHYEKEWY